MMALPALDDDKQQREHNFSSAVELVWWVSLQRADRGLSGYGRAGEDLGALDSAVLKAIYLPERLLMSNYLEPMGLIALSWMATAAVGYSQRPC